jgi:hypothetical protein
VSLARAGHAVAGEGRELYSDRRAFAGGADTENTNVMLEFDQNSVLTNYSATQGSSSMGTGINSGARQ